MNLQLATTIYHEVRHLDYVGPEHLLHTARGAVRVRALACPAAGRTRAHIRPRQHLVTTGLPEPPSPAVQWPPVLMVDLPRGHHSLHDCLPGRVRYPRAWGEAKFAILQPSGIGPIMSARLADLGSL
eukprot:3048259-Pyramimonas_sp.AAC.1